VSVWLSPVGKAKGQPIDFEYDRAAAAYVARGRAGGRYQLTVGKRGLEGDERVVDVGAGANQERFVLGTKNLPTTTASAFAFPSTYGSGRGGARGACAG
jgi:hypothetical protein